MVNNRSTTFAPYSSAALDSSGPVAFVRSSTTHVNPSASTRWFTFFADSPFSRPFLDARRFDSADAGPRPAEKLASPPRPGMHWYMYGPSCHCVCLNKLGSSSNSRRHRTGSQRVTALYKPKTARSPTDPDGFWDAPFSFSSSSFSLGGGLAAYTYVGLFLSSITIAIRGLAAATPFVALPPSVNRFVPLFTPPPPAPLVTRSPPERWNDTSNWCPAARSRPTASGNGLRTNGGCMVFTNTCL
jgi:hypothetical protein